MDQKENTTPGRRKPLPQQHVARLGDIVADGLVLEAHCLCKHRAPVDPQALLRRFGEWEFIKNLEKRFRCTACEAKGIAILKYRHPD